MSRAADCVAVRELTPELALGIADGEARALALAHLAGCPACRRHLERLSTTADELALLAPSAEPPVGFEARVLAEIGGSGADAARRHRQGWRRPATLVGVAAGAALAAAAAVWIALGSERDLAERYRETLAVADGRYFDVARLEAPGGRAAGTVFGYEGDPSWVLVVVAPPKPGEQGAVLGSGTYEAELLTAGGERVSLGSLEIRGGEGSVGGAIPVAYEELVEVRLIDRHRREVAESDLEESELEEPDG